MRNITEIILHCSDTTEGKDYTVADIDSWHRKRGFNCIGYHYVIYRDGSVHEGRDINAIGAHCKGHNANSIGVCYIGGRGANGKTKDTRTDAQKKAMHELVEQLCRRYPGAKVFGHNEFAAKDCPCFDVKKEFRQ
jgi:N-acetylmuramoyl-L-alanine amidase